MKTATNAYEIIGTSAKNTPDFFDLKKSPYDEFIVFVVGNTRRYRSRAALMEGANYYGAGVTFSDNFIMKTSRTAMRNKNPEPLLFCFDKVKGREWDEFKPIFKRENLKHVEGDVYGIPLRKLTQLDQYEGNGDCINRTTQWVKFAHPKQEGASVRAHMWTVDLDFWMECFSGGNELQLCNSITHMIGEEKESFDAYYYS
jgi:hypothetical protein